MNYSYVRVIDIYEYFYISTIYLNNVFYLNEMLRLHVSVE